MSYSKKLDELKKKISETAKDLDDKFNLSESIDKGSKAALDGIRKGADAASEGIESIRREVERLDHEHDVSGKVKRSTEEVVKTVKDGAKSAEATADDLLGGAEKYYEKVSQAAGAAEKTFKAGQSLQRGFEQAKEWVKQNPGKAAVVGLSVVIGTRAGGAFPSYDTVLLGAGGQGHWVFHSALAAYGVRKVSEHYLDYLTKQEKLIQEGKLTEADAARVEFQRNVAKYVGAPLLGAFSLATGATLIAESLSPGRIVGAPVELLIGGNPILSSIWLFSNGLICIHNGYKFFMMALGDEETVTRIVKEATLLLPAPE